MRPILLTAISALITFSANTTAVEKYNVNRANNEPYENKPIVSIEFMEGKHELINILGIATLIKKDLFSISDQIVFVADYERGNTPSLLLANSRLESLRSQLNELGFSPDRMSFLSKSSDEKSNYIDTFVIPHTWQGLSSSIVSEITKKQKDTIIVSDSDKKLLISNVSTALLKDGDAITSLNEFIKLLGWSELKAPNLKNTTFKFSTNFDFPQGYIKPLKPEAMLTVLEQVKNTYTELSSFNYEIYPLEGLVYFYNDGVAKSE